MKNVRQTGMVFRTFLLLASGTTTLAPCQSQQAANPRYLLRLHVLAIDNTHRTERLQPQWCSGSVPAVVGDAGATGAGQGDPCGTSGSLSFGGDEDFSGAGRADLVTPPAGTQALSFTYEGCGRVRVPPGFQGLPARWKKPGKLEVLIPSDRIDVATQDRPANKCTLTANLHEFVFLRMRNGTLVKITQEAYLRKPALRVFLSGGSETLQPRVSPTISVKQMKEQPE